MDNDSYFSQLINNNVFGHLKATLKKKKMLEHIADAATLGSINSFFTKFSTPCNQNSNVLYALIAQISTSQFEAHAGRAARHKPLVIYYKIMTDSDFMLLRKIQPNDTIKKIKKQKSLIHSKNACCNCK